MKAVSAITMCTSPICFAWRERSRESHAHPAALDSVRLCLAPSLDALASVNGEIIDRAFKACQQAAVCAFELDDWGCECYFCTRWWDASKEENFGRMCKTGRDRRQWEGVALAWLSNLSSQD